MQFVPVVCCVGALCAPVRMPPLCVCVCVLWGGGWEEIPGPDRVPEEVLDRLHSVSDPEPLAGMEWLAPHVVCVDGTRAR